MYRLSLLCVLWFTHYPLQAAEVIVSFDNPEQSAMYHSLLKEYRCLKCQNQNLADSHASLAGDLRREIRTQILSGKGKQDIDQYLVSRYGEFVLYRPRFSAKTALLWIAPFALLALAVMGFLIMVRRQSPSQRSEQGPGQRPGQVPNHSHQVPADKSVLREQDVNDESQARLDRARRLLGD